MNLQGYYTEKGLVLAAKVSAGTKLTVTKVTAGGGTTAANALALAEEKQTLTVGTAEVSGQTAQLPAASAAILSAAYASLGPLELILALIELVVVFLILAQLFRRLFADNSVKRLAEFGLGLFLLMVIQYGKWGMLVSFIAYGMELAGLLVLGKQKKLKP